MDQVARGDAGVDKAVFCFYNAALFTATLLR